MKEDILISRIKVIKKQLEKYELLNSFSSTEEMEEWIRELNDIEINNIINLEIDQEEIKFDKKLLLNKDLLNTKDYNKRVQALISIKNAEGWYHLFDKMLNSEFLHSPKFYQDIETLKRAKSAQMPLWIIGEPEFINSPYHDEDFELLVTSKDTSNRDCDFLVWDAIATISKNVDSIKSEYHRKDLQTIIKYSSEALQSSYSYPEGSINYLAVNPVSLNDHYHLENMEILAKNREIGNFLYAVMTNQEAINRRDYRTIIREMIEYKDYKKYVFLLCVYAVGEEDAKNALRLNEFYYNEIKKQLPELLEKVNEKINIVDSTIVKEEQIYQIESCEIEYSQKKVKKYLRKILKKVSK